MKVIKLDQVFEGIKEQYEDNGVTYKPSLFWRGLLMKAVDIKYQKGMQLSIQKMLWKIDDTLEKAVNDFELSDEQFDFLFELITKTEMPRSKAIVEIAEVLEEVKFGKPKETK